MSCGIGHRLGSDLELLWLWCGQAAVALIGPLVWEPLHAKGMALKRPPPQKKKKSYQQCMRVPVSLFPSMKCYLIVLICISLMAKDVEHIFMYLLAVCLFREMSIQLLCPSFFFFP